MAFKPVPMRAANNYDAEQVSRDSATVYNITKQSDPIRAVEDKSTDINVIVANARSTGMLPFTAMQPLMEFMDEPPETLGDALRQVEEAKRAFMLLPPEIRAEFDNNPSQAQHAFASMTEAQIVEYINGKTKAGNSTTGNSSGSAGPGAAGNDNPGGAASGVPSGTPKPDK